MTAYRIPELHPLLVHFPLVLLIVAAALAVAFLVRDRIVWLHGAASFEGAGLASGLLTYRSGVRLAVAEEGGLMVERFAGLHESAAVWTLVAAAVALLSMGWAAWWSVRNTNHPGTAVILRWVVALLSLCAAALVLWTGHVGGIMVWGVAG